MAKGHDFPAVNVAVVVSADHMLMMPDFEPLSGPTPDHAGRRPGRQGLPEGTRPGSDLSPTEHEVFNHMHDYRSFHERECERRLFGFALHRLVMLRLESSQLRQVQSAAARLARRLREELQGRDPCPAQVLGPSPAAMSRLMGRWRYQILLRGSRSKTFETGSARPLSLCHRTSGGEAGGGRGPEERAED